MPTTVLGTQPLLLLFECLLWINLNHSSQEHPLDFQWSHINQALQPRDPEILITYLSGFDWRLQVTQFSNPSKPPGPFTTQRHSSNQITTSNLASVTRIRRVQGSVSYHQPQNKCFIIPDLPLTSTAVSLPSQGDGARAWFWAKVHCLPINCLASLPLFTFFAFSKWLSTKLWDSWGIHC